MPLLFEPRGTIAGWGAPPVPQQPAEHIGAIRVTVNLGLSTSSGWAHSLPAENLDLPVDASQGDVHLVDQPTHRFSLSLKASGRG